MTSPDLVTSPPGKQEFPRGHLTYTKQRQQDALPQRGPPGCAAGGGRPAHADWTKWHRQPLHNTRRLNGTQVCESLALGDIPHFLYHEMFSPEPSLCDWISCLGSVFELLAFIFFDKNSFMVFLIILMSASCHYQHMIFLTFLFLSSYMFFLKLLLSSLFIDDFL